VAGTDSSFFPCGWNRTIFDEQVRNFAALDLSPANARLIFGENIEKLLCPAALSS
jgi:hypothetical protein